MAKTKVSEFDATASNNTDINSVNVAEGCPPSGINNAIREMASLLKKQEVGTDPMTSPDINGGTIDGATIGASSASTGAFTTLTASGNVDFNGDLDVDGTTNLDVVDIDGALTQDGGAVFNEGSADVDFRVESNGNANMLFVDGGNDRVGVNISTPQAPLHVTGTIKVATGNAQGILALGEGLGTGVNVGLWRGDANNPTSDGNFLNLGGYGGIVFASSATAIGSQTERMRIDSSGNVGIGVTGGAIKLDVLTTVSDNFVAKFENSHATGSYGIAVKAGDDSGNYTADFANKSGTSLMRILGDGNIGFGDNAPVARNHIKGDGTSGQVTASWILENFNSGTAGMDITGSAGASRWRFLYGGGPSTGTNTLNEAMCILTEGSNAGKVLLGTTSARSSSSKIELFSPASTALSFYMFKNTQVEVNMGFKAGTDSNFYISTGDVTVGSTGKGVYLTNAGTSWTSNSDFRKKKNLVAIENALDKIANCRAMTGHFNGEEDDAKKRPFLIAQDWVTALPEAVDQDTTDDDGNESLGLSYEGTIPLLVACIKELREQNIALTTRITALEGE